MPPGPKPQGFRWVRLNLYVPLDLRVLINRVAERLDKPNSELVREAIWARLKSDATADELAEYSEARKGWAHDAR